MVQLPLNTKKAPRCSQTPAPAAECGVQPALGSALSSPRPLPGLSRWQNGCCGAQTRVDYPPEGLCQIPVEHRYSTSRGHRATWNRGDEIRLLLFLASLPLAEHVPAVPGGDAGRAQRKAEERGQILGVTPCLVAVRLFPFMPGAKQAGRRSRNAIIVFC